MWKEAFEQEFRAKHKNKTVAELLVLDQGNKSKIITDMVTGKLRVKPWVSK